MTETMGQGSPILVKEESLTWATHKQLLVTLLTAAAWRVTCYAFCEHCGSNTPMKVSGGPVITYRI